MDRRRRTTLQTTTLAPGGAYVLAAEHEEDISRSRLGLEMTLVFEKAGEVVIDAALDAPDAVHAHDADAQARSEKRT